jgi:hypothetical protein
MIRFTFLWIHFLPHQCFSASYRVDKRNDSRKMSVHRQNNLHVWISKIAWGSFSSIRMRLTTRTVSLKKTPRKEWADLLHVKYAYCNHLKVRMASPR